MICFDCKKKLYRKDRKISAFIDGTSVFLCQSCASIRLGNVNKLNFKMEKNNDKTK